MLREHHEPLEADLQRFYGVDLVDLYRGTLSLRKVWVFVQGLPRDCALRRAHLGDAAVDWSPEVQFLAEGLNASREGFWGLAECLRNQLTTKAGGPPENVFGEKPPEPVRPPGGLANEVTESSSAIASPGDEIAAFFGVVNPAPETADTPKPDVVSSAKMAEQLFGGS